MRDDEIILLRDGRVTGCEILTLPEARTRARYLMVELRAAVNTGHPIAARNEAVKLWRLGISMMEAKGYTYV